MTARAVAGFGLRTAATLESLRKALHIASNENIFALTALATAADKANHPALIALARELALPLIAVPLAQLTASSAATAPPNNRIPERYGARSVAESSALAAAGQGAQLLAARAVSTDKMATAAIAILHFHPCYP
ncbi:cobalamin biosynthesis protein [Simplicispira psychrophila]|uniref:cobalamin biosynthesis protein n=1 Tax=Simplicispira psychrophila TaxID=80882 RepID=UPI00068A5AB9|nr:cobalamin biosynthesis protein [Simplicispira psychrophila]